MTKKAKSKGGRPSKYRPEYALAVEELCREQGYTDKNLAQHFKVSERTINQWKKGYPQFLQSLKKGKDEFDTRVVEQALLKRAVGYSYDETTREPIVEYDEEGNEIGEKSLTVTKVVRKQIAPDVTAQIFWLKNRNPKRWSDKKEIEHRIEGITEPLTEEELLERLKRAREAGTGIDTKSIEGGHGSSDKKTS